MPKNWLLKALCTISALITVIATAYYAHQGRLHRPGWIVPTVVMIFLLVLHVALYVYQSKKRKSFPVITKHWYIPLLPTIFIFGTLVSLALPNRNSNDLSVDLTFIFGAISIISLTLSIAVLVTLRESIYDEVQHMEAAIELIRSARKSLVLLSLTPNLGFAKAMDNHEFALCQKFTEVLLSKLDEFTQYASLGKDVEIKIGMLGTPDYETFLRSKEAGLASGKAETAGQANLGESYRYRSGLLQEKFRMRIQNAQAITNGHMKVSYIEWKPNCTMLSPQNEPSPTLPPISILIADDHTAIIHFNHVLLTPQPVGLKGRILHLPEEIEAFSSLVDAYISYYRR